MSNPAASSAFEAFSSSTTFKGITHSFFQLCLALGVDPADHSNIYESVRQLEDWKAQKLFKILDKKRQQPEYGENRAASRYNVLVIGAGPCGLRAAIEAALLGCRVVVLEQRDKFSRNNVLHLWEFVIADLKGLGAKFFYPKFCTGSIEHISIRQLQCILLKVSLLFGVQIYDSVSFKQILMPTEETSLSGSGFRAVLDPSDHIISNFEFDVLIGADGKRNTVPGFPREEMRGKLAIGITANFVNRRTSEEERVAEISGVAYIFNQSFFKEMYEVTGVDLENIVYYKDETHYFVMCAKKASLLEQGVIRKDSDDVTSLLSPSNVDESALCRFASAAADFATKSKLPQLDFATNQRGHPDVAMFDFTSLYSSKCSVRLVKTAGRSLLLGIVGDSLHEPFWPTGSGCARGFLGVWDTAWLIRQLAVSGRDEMDLIAEREGVYRLLAQVTKDNMHKNMTKYTIDPRTRYISPEMNGRPDDVALLVCGDNKPAVSLGSRSQSPSLLRLLSAHKFCMQALSSYKLRVTNLSSSFRDGRALGALLSKFLNEYIDYSHLVTIEDVDKRVETCLAVVRDRVGLAVPSTKWTETEDDVIAGFICNVVTAIRKDSERTVKAITPRTTSLKRKGKQPQVDASKARKAAPIERLAQDVLACSSFRGLTGVAQRPSSYPRPLSSERLSALVPPMRHYTERPQAEKLNPHLVNKVEKIVTVERVKEDEKEVCKEKEDRAEKTASVTDMQKEVVEGIEKRKGKEKEVDKCHSLSEQRLKHNDPLAGGSIRATKPSLPLPIPKKTSSTDQENGEVRIRKVTHSPPSRRALSMSVVDPARNACSFCNKTVYMAERVLVEGLTLHKSCFRCAFCTQALRLGECSVERNMDCYKRFRLYCKTHSRLPLRERLSRIERSERRGSRGHLGKAASVEEEPHTPILTKKKEEEVETPLSPRRHTVTVDAVDSTIQVVDKNGLTDMSRVNGSGKTNGTTEGAHPFSPSSSSTLFFFDDSTLPSVRDPDVLKSPLDERGCDTPERAVFALLDNEPRCKLSPSTSLEDEEDEEEEMNLEATQESGIDEEEEEELGEDDLVELERTVREMEEDDDVDDVCSEKQALSIIETINRRRSTKFDEGRRRADSVPYRNGESLRPVEGMRERAASELEARRAEARERARQKSDEQLGLDLTPTHHHLPPSTMSSSSPPPLSTSPMPKRASTATSTSSSQSPQSQPGLLSRLFSPITSRRAQPIVDGVTVLSESTKEREQLGKSYRRMKHTRALSFEKEDHHPSHSHPRLPDSPPQQTMIVTQPLPQQATPMAIVPPSPRPTSAASTIPIDDASVRLVQRKVERLKRQRADDRKRTGQDIQRGLEECEIRLEEVRREGEDVERTLNGDPTCTRYLELWYSLVQERDRLVERDRDLRLRAREMETDERYKELSRRFKEMSADGNDEEQAHLLQEMMVALRARGVAREEAESARGTPKRREAPHVALQRHGYNYLNFQREFI